jgi:putative endonuclease
VPIRRWAYKPRRRRMPFWVYVLRSATACRRYVGQTADLARRLSEHNGLSANLHKYTSTHAGPWSLVHPELVGSRADAMRRERFHGGVSLP